METSWRLLTAANLGEDCFKPTARRLIAGAADHELNSWLGESTQRGQLGLGRLRRWLLLGTSAGQCVPQPLAIFRSERFLSAHENADTLIRRGINLERQ